MAPVSPSRPSDESNSRINYRDIKRQKWRSLLLWQCRLCQTKASNQHCTKTCLFKNVDVYEKHCMVTPGIDARWPKSKQYYHDIEYLVSCINFKRYKAILQGNERYLIFKTNILIQNIFNYLTLMYVWLWV